jgi:YesN/AraC family two-component response regulator
MEKTKIMPIKLLITDFKMPALNGVDLAMSLFKFIDKINKD